MIFADTQKPYLRKYGLVAELDVFFQKVAEISDQYKFISATERRCFNLANKLMVGPGRDRLVSNCGLLLQHQQLANYYARHGRFPKILLLDDLLIHGRGLGKFLRRLEYALELDLQGMTKSFDMGDFRRQLIRSIDIRVFARCKRPLLLEERYLDRLRPHLELSSNEIHDLSLQLTDALTRLEIANTCFVYSCQMDPAAFVSEPKNWRRIDWNYQQESMLLYVCLSAKGRVSTIRSFSNRYAAWNAPLFTSFTILGSLSGSSLDHCARVLSEIFDQSGMDCSLLCGILKDRNPYARSSKTQLVNFFCSVIDLRDFFQETGQVFSQDVRDDLDKISRNFGVSGDIAPELQEIVASGDVMNRIKEVLYPILDQVLEPLGFTAERAPTEASVEEVNQAIRDIFYEIGIASEARAVYHSEAIHLFLPDAYQSYDEENSRIFSDGILSIRDFNVLAEDRLALSDPYCRVAGFIAAMDCGIMGARIQSSTYGEMEYALCKAGEMATAYGPERLAVALPAFDLLERYSRKIDMEPLDAILEFCSGLTEEKMRSYLNDEYYSRVADLRRSHPDLIENLPSLAKKYCKMMYDGGQQMQDWNFENITVRPDRGWMTYQWYLQKQALEFLCMTDN